MGLLLLVFVLSSSAMANLNESDVKRLIQTLPGRTLSLENVVARGISSSDSYKLAISGGAAEEAARLAAQGPLDARIGLSYLRTRNNNEASNSFSPNRIDSDFSQIQISKYFATGTTISTELSQTHNSIGFAAGSIINTPPYYETKLGFGLSQNLWQDSFGAGTRSQLASGELVSLANQIQTKESRESWFIGFVDLYYNAWLAQARAQASRSGFERRNRLVSYTKIKLRRGTAETPDLLQVESARLQSQNQMELADQDLADRWRHLVLALKLPPALLSLDPMRIPMKLDEVNPSAFKMCGSEESPLPPPSNSSSLTRAALLSEAARQSENHAQWMVKPDVELRFNYNPNGIDPSSSTSFQDVRESSHPSWSVGIVATMPLGFSTEKSRLAQSRADAIAKEVGFISAKDNFIVEWVNTCKALYRLDRALQNDKQALENQTRRVKLEEERFRFGRTSTMAVIQAGDDLVSAELSFKASEVNRRRVVWRLLQLNDQLNKKIDEIAKLDHLPRKFEL